MTVSKARPRASRSVDFQNILHRDQIGNLQGNETEMMLEFGENETQIDIPPSDAGGGFDVIQRVGTLRRQRSHGLTRAKNDV